MPNSLKKFIERQLKENVPLTDIKKDLKEKGYDIEAVNKAVREAIAGLDKKISNTTIIQIGILVVGLAIALWAGVYFTSNKQDVPIAIPIEVPAPPLAAEPNTITERLCGNYPLVAGGVTCEDAIKIASSQHDGEVQKVSIEPIQMVIPSPNGTFTRETVNMWLIDIGLAEPYFIQKPGKESKETNFLRIGIRLDGGTEIYRKALDV